MAEAENQSPQPDLEMKQESKEPEAVFNAAPKKPLGRIIKPPVEPEDPTLYLKTWTGG